MNFSALAPTDARDYARSLGWEVVPEALDHRRYLLAHPNIPYRQIMIPVDTSAPDYGEAIQITMTKLAELHDLPLRHVILAVQTARKNAEPSFAWAANAPLSAGSRVRDTIRIQGDYFGRIEAVQRALRATERLQEDTFIGTVERLDGEMDMDGRRTGDVIIALLLPEGEGVRARMTLDADAYDAAARAHLTQGAYVIVTGRLHPGRQPRLLSGIRQFGLLLPPPE